MEIYNDIYETDQIDATHIYIMYSHINNITGTMFV
jgi:hypothetical protein